MQAQNNPKPYKKRNKNNFQQPTYQNLNPFKAVQKKYKFYQHKQTDFSELYQPKQYQIIDGYQVSVLNWPKGTILVRKFNPPKKIIEIGLLGLNLYSKKPYRTNLDGIQKLYKEQQKQIQQQQKQQKKQQQKQQLLIKEDIETMIKQKGYIFNDKIRWANVGYQYDWSQRKYPSTKTDMHQSIAQMSQKANNLYNKIKNTQFKYQAQSAIVNFYGQKDYMTGHLDDAEIDQVSPIYSFSFGLSCIFVIGGPNKDQKPVAIRLNSGDLLIMSQDSRKSYHGVPRVLKNSFEAKIFDQIQIQKKYKQDEEFKKWQNWQKQICQYFKSHRININIRQVYPKQNDKIEQ